MQSEYLYERIADYILANPLATLSTIGLDGAPHGAVVYVCPDDVRHAVYFITKTGTQKYKNLSRHDHVSLTVVNPAENSTLQASGRAFVVKDAQTIDDVVKKIARAHALASEWMPPIAKLRAGAYIIVGVELWHARLAQYQGMEIGDERIFTEL